MNYCAKCCLPTTEEKCPSCGSVTRLLRNDDMCFVCYAGSIWSRMFEQTLDNNAIPHFCFIMGNEGKHSIDGIFVPSAYYVVAKDIYRTLFGGKADEPDESILGQTVTVTVDCPMFSVQPEHSDLCYPVNCGYIENVMGGNGDWQGAYVLGIDNPVESFAGNVIAIIIRRNRAETMWVVAPQDADFTERDIRLATEFQERFFDIEILM